MPRTMHTDNRPVYRVLVVTTGHTPTGEPVHEQQAYDPYEAQGTAKSILSREKNGWEHFKKNITRSPLTPYNSVNGVHQLQFVDKTFMLQSTSYAWTSV